MPAIFLGLGSNVGGRELNIHEAVRKISLLPETCIIKTGSLYETEPFGLHGQPYFINTAIEISTGIEPRNFHRMTKRIELEIGRVPRGTWGPREIDIDILLIDQSVINEDSLKVPHPGLEQRRFVLVPLAEIAPDLMHPILRRTTGELLALCADASAVNFYKKM